MRAVVEVAAAGNGGVEVARKGDAIGSQGAPCLGGSQQAGAEAYYSTPLVDDGEGEDDEARP
jgi:hypothetical protein